MSHLVISLQIINIKKTLQTKYGFFSFPELNKLQVLEKIINLSKSMLMKCLLLVRTVI